MTKGQALTWAPNWQSALRMTNYDQTTLHTGGRKQNGVVVHFIIVH